MNPLPKSTNPHKSSPKVLQILFQSLTDPNESSPNVLQIHSQSLMNPLLKSHEFSQILSQSLTNSDKSFPNNKEYTLPCCHDLENSRVPNFFISINQIH